MPEITISYSTESKGKIESGKLFIKEVFKDFWFKIPDYQRSYVWGEDEIIELLEDISYAIDNTPEDEYFLGSMVLQKKKITQKLDGNSLEYLEYDVLDGQQRLTTLILLLAVIRDVCAEDNLRSSCEKYIFQKENTFENIPERDRIIFDIRDDVQDFIKDFVHEGTATSQEDLLKEKINTKNVSISNMAKALLTLRGYFAPMDQPEINKFAKYLFNKILMIYVSSEDLKDAFRLFTILNDRGIPLTNSDILKAKNLGVINNPAEKKKYAIFWEETENTIGREEFDRILSYIRTIMVKDKARENILKEFDEKIYGTTPAKLKLGSETMETVRDYVTIYDQLLFFNNIPADIGNEFKNLITIMRYSLPSTDWIPPLLSYFKKFGTENILKFLKKLDNKFSADWITQLTPTFRINNMNEILKEIEQQNSSINVNNNPQIFNIQKLNFINVLSQDIYIRKFAKYILLKLEYLAKDHSSLFNTFDHISVEHVLPQNPSQNSNWWNLFTEDQHSFLLNKLGNLVLLSRVKNASLSNKDFDEKKRKYFSGNIDSFPNSLTVMQNINWTIAEITERQKTLLEKLENYYT